jgi:SpoVK/Ycf46/Vps4 family AAA+-type ATPase
MSSYYKLKQKTSFEDLIYNDKITLPTSDLCFQSDTHIFQFEFVEDKDKKEKTLIEPGIFTLVNSMNSLKLEKSELRPRELLEDIVSTTAILSEARTFFNKLHIYEKLKRLKKRGVLLYSEPGLGKTTAIEKFCLESIKDDPGTVICVWPTSKVEADDVSEFLNLKSEFHESCTRLILVVEDIGGGERDSQGGPDPVSSGLLNLLDGVGMTFTKPTFIVATTNHAQNLLSSLADRPGRFDLMLKLAPPGPEERVRLLEFIAKRPITEDERKAITGRGTDKFSIAHIEEVVVRAELHDKTFQEVVDEIIAHQRSFKKGFYEVPEVGF